jgi:hypothetical protein
MLAEQRTQKPCNKMAPNGVFRIALEWAALSVDVRPNLKAGEKI